MNREQCKVIIERFHPKMRPAMRKAVADVVCDNGNVQQTVNIHNMFHRDNQIAAPNLHQRCKEVRQTYDVVMKIAKI